MDPKKLGDDLVVKIRPDFSRGFADLWEVRDALVAVCQELDRTNAAFIALKAAVAASDVAGNLKAGVAAVAAPTRTYIKLIDGTDSEL